MFDVSAQPRVSAPWRPFCTGKPACEQVLVSLGVPLATHPLSGLHMNSIRARPNTAPSGRSYISHLPVDPG